MSSEPLDRVIHLLSRLPGVGRKTATRHAFTILKRGEAVMGEMLTGGEARFMPKTLLKR